MKLNRMMPRVFVAALMVLLLLATVVGCNQDMPFNPDGAAQADDDRQTVHLIEWNNSGTSFQKTHTASKWINRYLGGNMSLFAKEINEDGSEGKMIFLSFTVLPLSISSSCAISVELDDEEIDMEFGPSGATFAPAALMNLTAMNLDLTGVDPSTLKLRYFNPDTEEWEAVPCGSTEIDLDLGLVVIKGALIDHFSRYALSHL